jgi:hypothetical protein
VVIEAYDGDATYRPCSLDTLRRRACYGQIKPMFYVDHRFAYPLIYKLLIIRATPTQKCGAATDSSGAGQDVDRDKNLPHYKSRGWPLTT